MGVKVDALVAEQLKKVEPAFAYFEAKTIELKVQLQFYEAAAMFHPVLVKRRGGLAEAELRRLIAYNKPATIAVLVSELSLYVAEFLTTPTPPSSPLNDCDVEALWHTSRLRVVRRLLAPGGPHSYVGATFFWAS